MLHRAFRFSEPIDARDPSIHGSERIKDWGLDPIFRSIFNHVSTSLSHSLQRPERCSRWAVADSPTTLHRTSSYGRIRSSPSHAGMNTPPSFAVSLEPAKEFGNRPNGIPPKWTRRVPSLKLLRVSSADAGFLFDRMSNEFRSDWIQLIKRFKYPALGLDSNRHRRYRDSFGLLILIPFNPSVYRLSILGRNEIHKGVPKKAPNLCIIRVHVSATENE